MYEEEEYRARPYPPRYTWPQEARRSSLAIPMTAGVLVIGLVIVGALVLVGLIFHEYWPLLSRVAVITIISCLLYPVVWLGAKGLHAIAEARHAWKRDDLQVIKGKGYVVAVKEGREPLSWRPPPPLPQGLHVLHMHNQALPAADALAIEAPPALPVARSIYEHMPSGRDGRILLGYDVAGPLWLQVDELLSIAMAGNSGRGKSNALLWLVLQFLRQGISVTILDGKGDLRRWIGAYHPVAYTPAEMVQAVRSLLAEGQRRLDDASLHAGATPPLLMAVIDELDLVEGRAPEVVSLIELLTKKTRSVNMHGIYSNQSVPAELVGGVQTRGVISSRICLYCDDEAARLIGVRKDNGGAALLQQIAPPAPKGLAVARTVAFGWKLIAFPEVPESAVHWLLQGIPPLPPLPPNPNRRDSLSLADEPQEPPKTVVDEERERILAMLADHPTWSNAAIAHALGYGNNNKQSVIKSIREEGN